MKRTTIKRKYLNDLSGLPYYLSVTQVSQLTGLTEECIKKHLRSGELKGKKICNQWRISQDDFIAMQDPS